MVENVAESQCAKVLLQGGQKQPVNGSITLENSQLGGGNYPKSEYICRCHKPIYRQQEVWCLWDPLRHPLAGIFWRGRPNSQWRAASHHVNQHHALGALGAAFNARAVERSLGILRDITMSPQYESSWGFWESSSQHLNNHIAKFTRHVSDSGDEPDQCTSSRRRGWCGNPVSMQVNAGWTNNSSSRRS